MGLGVVSSVLTLFKADTSDLKQGLKELTGLEKEHAAAQLKNTEARNKGLDDWMGRLAKANQVLELVGKALGAVEDYGHKLDLQAAAAGVSIEGLAKASKGLKTNLELLEHAARFNTSAFKLTQEQMETAEKAMYMLEERGLKSEEVWGAVDAALTKGAIKPLEQFGIIIDKTGLALDENGLKVDTFGQKQEALRRIMAALTETAKGAEESQHDAADETQVTIVKLKNYWEEAKEGLAKVVIALMPIIELLAKAVELAADLIGKLGKSVGMDALLQAQEDAARLRAKIENAYENSGGTTAGFAAAYKKTMAGPGGVPVEAPDAWEQGMGAGTVDQGAYANFMSGRFKKPDNKAFEKEMADYFAERADIIQQEFDEAAKAALERMDQDALENAIKPNFKIDVIDLSGLDETFKQIESEVDARTAEMYEHFNAQQAQSFLSSVFGDIEEFNAYATAFDMLTGSVTTAMDAWITGSVSAGEAVKRFIAGALKSLASQMAVEALKHGAYAIGSAAFGDYRGAAQHGQAAVVFGAAAAAAAVAAKSMGGGAAPPAAAQGGSSGGGSGSGGAGSSVSSPSGKQESKAPIYVIVGDSFSEDSPRMRSIRSKEAVDKALRERDE